MSKQPPAQLLTHWFEPNAECVVVQSALTTGCHPSASSRDKSFLPLLLATPILNQSNGMLASGYGASRWKVLHDVTAACLRSDTADFFELTAALATGLIGLNMGAALVTVVGVLVGVVVMVTLGIPQTVHAAHFHDCHGGLGKSLKKKPHATARLVSKAMIIGPQENAPAAALLVNVRR
ncbi:MAG: hypothetical protein ACXIU7_13300 [Roseinatronobacter sp.]